MLRSFARHVVIMMMDGYGRLQFATRSLWATSTSTSSRSPSPWLRARASLSSGRARRLRRRSSPPCRRSCWPNCDGSSVDGWTEGGREDGTNHFIFGQGREIDPSVLSIDSGERELKVNMNYRVLPVMVLYRLGLLRTYKIVQQVRPSDIAPAAAATGSLRPFDRRTAFSLCELAHDHLIRFLLF
jgi:hypothetical protein